MSSRLHQKILYKLLNDLDAQGFHTIDMTGCVPDAIAVKDNKIYAIEVLTRTGSEHNNNTDQFNIRKKEVKYNLYGYDDIIFKAINKKIWLKEHPNEDIQIEQEYERDIERKKLRELSAQGIVQKFIDNDCKFTK